MNNCKNDNLINKEEEKKINKFKNNILSNFLLKYELMIKNFKTNFNHYIYNKYENIIFENNFKDDFNVNKNKFNEVVLENKKEKYKIIVKITNNENIKKEFNIFLLKEFNKKKRNWNIY